MSRQSFLACIALSLISLVFLSVRLCADNAPPHAPPRYTITDLVSLGNYPCSGAYSLNEIGQIVGWSGTDNSKGGLRQTRAFLWQDGHMQEIPLPPNTPYPAGYRINDHGQVLIKPVMLLNGGYSGPFPDYTYLWHTGNLTKTSLNQAIDLNRNGQILTHFLFRDAPKPHYSVVLCQGDQQILVLDAPPGYAQDFAYAMNDNGQIVGEVSNYDEKKGQFRDQHPFVYRDGKLRVLDVPADMTMSKAVAINSAGDVLIQGWSQGLHRGTYSLLWQNGKWTDLDKNRQFPYLQAGGLNDKGQAVGNYWTPDTVHAFVWQNGQVTDLNQRIPADSGWTLLDAVAINNKGWIIGDGLHNGVARAFLLKPVVSAPVRSQFGGAGFGEGAIGGSH